MTTLVQYPGKLAYLDPSGDFSGVTDQANIQSLYNLGAKTVQLNGSSYYLLFPITMPPGSVLLGTHGRIPNGILGGTVIVPTAGFTGSQVIGLAKGIEVEIGNLTIDCSALSSAAAIDGISLLDTVGNGYLHNIMVLNAPRSGFNVGNGTASGVPGSFRFDHFYVNGTGNGAGINPSNMTDCTFKDVYVLASNAQGFYLNGMANCTFVACRAEWSATSYGWQIDGANGFGVRFIGCSTDRNWQHGWIFTCTGTDPVLLDGTVCHRDGKGSTSAGYAGIHVANTCTNPVILNGLAVYPGVDDGGGGNASPQYGLDISGTPTYVGVTNAFLHAMTTFLNGAPTRSRLISGRTGYPTPGAITTPADI